MIVQDIQIGDRVRSTLRLTDPETGDPLDPPFVLFIVQRPDLTEHVSTFGELAQPYPITKDDDGVYYADIPLIVIAPDASLLGKIRWARRWQTYDELGAPLSSKERHLFVDGSNLSTPIPTITP